MHEKFHSHQFYILVVRETVPGTRLSFIVSWEMRANQARSDFIGKFLICADTDKIFLNDKT